MTDHTHGDFDTLSTSQIGNTGLEVTKLGLGGAALGGLYRDVSKEVAAKTIQRGFQLGVRYFDTAPAYGHGKSEHYFGRGLAEINREQFVLSTKVGRVLNSVDSMPDGGHFINPSSYQPVFDFSRDGIIRSLEDSLRRLGLNKIDIAFIHDPDEGESVEGDTFGEPIYYRKVLSETYPTLEDLRSQGVIGAIGVGMNQWQSLVQFSKDAQFDCFLLAGRYTLLDQSALGELMPICETKNISVIIGGPYNSGILASDLSKKTSYFYSQSPPHILERARQIKSVCDRYDVPLKAAALQFGLAHPAVAATIPGARSIDELEDNLRMFKYPIPFKFWEELKFTGFIPRDAPVPLGD